MVINHNMSSMYSVQVSVLTKLAMTLQDLQYLKRCAVRFVD